MNRRQFFQLTGPATAGLLASCHSTRPAPVAAEIPATPPATGPARLSGVPVLFNPGPVPRRLPPGVRTSWSSARVNGSYAAMTFDDGPHAVNTPRLLDMLQRWNIRATFFLIGANAAAHPALVRRIVAEGHEVGNHSWSHPAFAKMDDASVRTELRRTHDAIASACGIPPLVYRPPYGSITSAQKEWISREFGYPTILWSVDPNDWKDRNADTVSSRILSASRAGSIILAHDIHATSVSAMPSTLPALSRRGLRFLTVSQLIRAESASATLVSTAPV